MLTEISFWGELLYPFKQCVEEGKKICKREHQMNFFQVEHTPDWATNPSNITMCTQPHTIE